MKRRAKRGSGAPRTAKLRATSAKGAAAIEIKRDAGCVTATLSGPDGNRLSAAAAATLIELAQEVEDDESIKVLVVTGAGGTFCSGFDPGVDLHLVDTLAALAKPTVALIGGDAMDEGLELAMGLDIRATTAASRLALRQLLHGAMPRFGGTQRLPRLIGGGEALRLVLTGEVIDGRRALELGLVTYLAGTAQELSALAAQLIESITSRAPLAASLVKEAVVKGFDMTLGQGIRLEEDLYALLQTTADRAEGVRSFLEKRKPLFKGV
jgi:enoyl-CoA hydratase/carnithine racemase